MSELTRIQIVVALQSSDLFAFCRAEEILRIAGIASERFYAAGAKIYEQGGPADMLYSVVHGEIRLQGGDGQPRTVGPLQSFGSRDILCGRLRAREAIAVKGSLLLAIEAENLFDLLANNIDIIKGLFRSLLQDGASSSASTRTGS